MACMLFFYSRTSIQAARLNAQKHREADGGQLSWRNESLRRHGQMEKIVDGDHKLIREAFRDTPVTSKDIARERAERGEGLVVASGLSDSEQAKALEKYKKKQRQASGIDD
ncbi:uncharacterized protein PV09_03671 [Verruconis gallopava]|uniref:Uncharacterized protein n=1 Tax=Verruconis gallopava TaxID=253628 RepID=A0A0D2AF63_9PEZI|nr:uncharacterized protein PV09_03671 [Verruconis gallopava]KIW05115.1 hypothetical protein PV09_03671 [Verruconis gallopava]